MTRIPPKIRALMANDPFYRRCCISGDKGIRNDPIEWHHNLIFAGRQVQEVFAILPIKRSLHREVDINKELKSRLNWVMLNRASEEQIEKYSKVRELGMELMALNCFFGDYTGKSPEVGILY